MTIALPLFIALAALAAQAGEIRGLVVSAHGGAPLASVEVTLAGTTSSEDGGSTFSSTHTGLDGRFRFSELDSGGYVLGFKKDGWEGGSRVSRHTELSEAGMDETLEVRLRRSVAISGRVLDPDGDPLAGAEVQVREWTTAQGRRLLRPINSTRTDDLGDYRMWGLNPGRYIVTVSPQPLPAPAGVHAVEYTTRHYPGLDRAADAPPLDLDWGSEATGIDFRLPRSAPTALEGAVFDAGGGPCSRCPVTLAVATGDEFVAGIAATEEGLFAFRGIAPGDYRLIAGGGRNARMGAADVHVPADRPVTAAVTVHEGQTVSGRVIAEGFEPSTEEGTANLVVLRLFDIGGLLTRNRLQAAANLAEGGAFQFEGVPPGRFRVSVARSPQGGYLERLSLNGSLLREGEIFVSGTPLHNLDVELSFDGGRVHGRVEGGAPAAGDAAPNGLAVLLPDPYGVGGRFEMLADYRPSDGMFDFRDVPPGVYTLFAVPHDNRFDLGEPADVALLRRRGVRVRVTANGESAADAPFIATPE